MAIFRFVNNPQRIKAYLNDPEKKNILQVIKELITLAFYKKEIPYYYFTHLYKKEVDNIRDYLSTNQRAQIHADVEMNRVEYVSILENKLNFAFYFEKFNLRTPRAIAHNFSNHFFHKGNVQILHTNDDLKNYFRHILRSQEANELFARPLSLLGGKGCFKLTLDNLEEKLNEHKNSLIAQSYLFTEVIKQHPKINEIHRNAVNTIRFLTYITDEGKIEILSAAMRFGIGESVVDNNSSGGFFIKVDKREGTLAKAGWTKPHFGGIKITHHPDTNFKLEGFKIPFYQEACKMVVEYAQYIPHKLIGWDVAVGIDGPTVIEANHNPFLTLSDIGAEGLLRNPSFRSFMEEVTMRRKRRK
ncbi:sugar-transfer associated ATP-grasp domain-containing protein [Flagellimonas sp.]|uniref:sugar-transfer associated ATP-grasp domain-containing protein n=1 Tax=Flagellimonas sp. TaxID=2058762 RepID=UPI003B50A9E9